MQNILVMLGKSYAVHERGTDKSHGFYQGHDQGGQEGSGWPGLFGTCCQRGIHKCCDNTGKVVWSSHRVGERHHLGKVLVALCVLSMTANSNKQGENRFAGWDSLLKRGYYMEMCRGSLKNCNRMRWHIRGWEDEKRKIKESRKVCRGQGMNKPLDHTNKIGHLFFFLFWEPWEIMESF